jgi:uncharacterized protein (TIGR02271 family)
MSTQTITAVYDTQAEAERAVEALAAQGIPRSDLRIHRDAAEATTGGASMENQDKGFWASLGELYVPDDDRHTYAEALRRGSVMVTARVDDAHYEAAADLLETHGAVDLDARESSWRSEGWAGGRGIGQTRTSEVGSAADTATRLGMATGDASESGRGIGQTRTSEVGSAADTATRMDMATDGASESGRGIGQTRTSEVSSAADIATRMDMATDGASENGGLLSRNTDELTRSTNPGARPGGYTGMGTDVTTGTGLGEETGLAPGDQGRPGTMLSRGVDEVAGTNISGAHSENTIEGARGLAGSAAGTAAGTEMQTAAGTESIPVVEETLRVGKRAVSGGRVRVRSYVVETPVEEQVTLRTEHVDVERRPVDRPVTDADRLFQDRTIEATETSEEAVVAKEARVTEEVIIRKDTEQHTETVRDTVRRTEVEVERDADTTKPRPV